MKGSGLRCLGLSMGLLEDCPALKDQLSRENLEMLRIIDRKPLPVN
jgi:hypothetical protein